MSGPVTTPPQGRTSENNICKCTTVELEDFNPRQAMLLGALLKRPYFRSELNDLVGALNPPQVVSELRARGFEIPCERVPHIDRYGKKSRPGLYSLTDADRNKLEGDL